MKADSTVWSNAAYVFVGATALTLGDYFLSGALAFLAIGSAMYHATDDKRWQLTDEMGMYAVVPALIVLEWGIPEFAPAALVMMAISRAVPSLYMVPILYFAALPPGIHGLFTGEGGSGVLVSLPLMLIALLFNHEVKGRGRDLKDGVKPRPYTWHHSVWHLLTALGILTLYVL